jgi:hypothetical protein
MIDRQITLIGGPAERQQWAAVCTVVPLLFRTSGNGTVGDLQVSYSSVPFLYSEVIFTMRSASAAGKED